MLLSSVEHSSARASAPAALTVAPYVQQVMLSSVCPGPTVMC